MDLQVQEQLLVSADSLREVQSELESLLDIRIGTMSISDFQRDVVDQLNKNADIIKIIIRTIPPAPSSAPSVPPSPSTTISLSSTSTDAHPIPGTPLRHGRRRPVDSSGDVVHATTSAMLTSLSGGGGGVESGGGGARHRLSFTGDSVNGESVKMTPLSTTTRTTDSGHSKTVGTKKKKKKKLSTEREEVVTSLLQHSDTNVLTSSSFTAAIPSPPVVTSSSRGKSSGAAGGMEGGGTGRGSVENVGSQGEWSRPLMGALDVPRQSVLSTVSLEAGGGDEGNAVASSSGGGGVPVALTPGTLSETAAPSHPPAPLRSTPGNTPLPKERSSSATSGQQQITNSYAPPGGGIVGTGMENGLGNLRPSSSGGGGDPKEGGEEKEIEKVPSTSPFSWTSSSTSFMGGGGEGEEDGMGEGGGMNGPTGTAVSLTPPRASHVSRPSKLHKLGNHAPPVMMSLSNPPPSATPVTAAGTPSSATNSIGNTGYTSHPTTPSPSAAVTALVCTPVKKKLSSSSSVMDLEPAIQKIVLSRSNLACLLQDKFKGKFISVVQGCFARIRELNGYVVYQIVDVSPDKSVILDRIYSNDKRDVETVSNAAPVKDELAAWMKKMLSCSRPFPTAGFLAAKHGDMISALRVASGKEPLDGVTSSSGSASRPTSSRTLQKEEKDAVQAAPLQASPPGPPEENAQKEPRMSRARRFSNTVDLGELERIPPPLPMQSVPSPSASVVLRASTPMAAGEGEGGAARDPRRPTLQGGDGGTAATGKAKESKEEKGGGGRHAMHGLTTAPMMTNPPVGRPKIKKSEKKPEEKEEEKEAPNDNEWKERSNTMLFTSLSSFSTAALGNPDLGATAVSQTSSKLTTMEESTEREGTTHKTAPPTEEEGGREETTAEDPSPPSPAATSKPAKTGVHKSSTSHHHKGGPTTTKNSNGRTLTGQWETVQTTTGASTEPSPPSFPSASSSIVMESGERRKGGRREKVEDDRIQADDGAKGNGSHEGRHSLVYTNTATTVPISPSMSALPSAPNGGEGGWIAGSSLTSHPGSSRSSSQGSRPPESMGGRLALFKEESFYLEIGSQVLKDMSMHHDVSKEEEEKGERKKHQKSHSRERGMKKRHEKGREGEEEETEKDPSIATKGHTEGLTPNEGTAMEKSTRKEKEKKKKKPNEEREKDGRQRKGSPSEGKGMEYHRMLAPLSASPSLSTLSAAEGCHVMETGDARSHHSSMERTTTLQPSRVQDAISPENGEEGGGTGLRGNVEGQQKREVKEEEKQGNDMRRVHLRPLGVAAKLEKPATFPLFSRSDTERKPAGEEADGKSASTTGTSPPSLSVSPPLPNAKPTEDVTVSNGERIASSSSSLLSCPSRSSFCSSASSSSYGFRRSSLSFSSSSLSIPTRYSREPSKKKKKQKPQGDSSPPSTTVGTPSPPGLLAELPPPAQPVLERPAVRASASYHRHPHRRLLVDSSASSYPPLTASSDGAEVTVEDKHHHRKHSKHTATDSAGEGVLSFSPSQGEEGQKENEVNPSERRREYNASAPPQVLHTGYPLPSREKKGATPVPVEEGTAAPVALAALSDPFQYPFEMTPTLRDGTTKAPATALSSSSPLATEPTANAGISSKSGVPIIVQEDRGKGGVPRPITITTTTALASSVQGVPPSSSPLSTGVAVGSILTPTTTLPNSPTAMTPFLTRSGSPRASSMRYRSHSGGEVEDTGMAGGVVGSVPRMKSVLYGKHLHPAMEVPMGSTSPSGLPSSTPWMMRVASTCEASAKRSLPAWSALWWETFPTGRVSVPINDALHHIQVKSEFLWMCDANSLNPPPPPLPPAMSAVASTLSCSGSTCISASSPSVVSLPTPPLFFGEEGGGGKPFLGAFFSSSRSSSSSTPYVSMHSTIEKKRGKGGTGEEEDEEESTFPGGGARSYRRRPPAPLLPTKDEDGEWRHSYPFSSPLEGPVLASPSDHRLVMIATRQANAPRPSRLQGEGMGYPRSRPGMPAPSGAGGGTTTTMGMGPSFPLPYMTHDGHVGAYPTETPWLPAGAGMDTAAGRGASGVSPPAWPSFPHGYPPGSFPPPLPFYYYYGGHLSPWMMPHAIPDPAMSGMGVAGGGGGPATAGGPVGSTSTSPYTFPSPYAVYASLSSLPLTGGAVVPGPTAIHHSFAPPPMFPFPPGLAFSSSPSFAGSHPPPLRSDFSGCMLTLDPVGNSIVRDRDITDKGFTLCTFPVPWGRITSKKSPQSAFPFPPSRTSSSFVSQWYIALGQTSPGGEEGPYIEEEEEEDDEDDEEMDAVFQGEEDTVETDISTHAGTENTTEAVRQEGASRVGGGGGGDPPELISKKKFKAEPQDGVLESVTPEKGEVGGRRAAGTAPGDSDPQEEKEVREPTVPPSRSCPLRDGKMPRSRTKAREERTSSGRQDPGWSYRMVQPFVVFRGPSPDALHETNMTALPIPSFCGSNPAACGITQVQLVVYGGALHAFYIVQHPSCKKYVPQEVHWESFSSSAMPPSSYYDYYGSYAHRHAALSHPSPHGFPFPYVPSPPPSSTGGVGNDSVERGATTSTYSTSRKGPLEEEESEDGLAIGRATSSSLTSSRASSPPNGIESTSEMFRASSHRPHSPQPTNALGRSSLSPMNPVERENDEDVWRSSNPQWATNRKPENGEEGDEEVEPEVLAKRESSRSSFPWRTGEDGSEERKRKDPPEIVAGRASKSQDPLLLGSSTGSQERTPSHLPGVAPAVEGFGEGGRSTSGGGWSRSVTGMEEEERAGPPIRHSSGGEVSGGSAEGGHQRGSGRDQRGTSIHSGRSSSGSLANGTGRGSGRLHRALRSTATRHWTMVHCNHPYGYSEPAGGENGKSDPQEGEGGQKEKGGVRRVVVQQYSLIHAVTDCFSFGETEDSEEVEEEEERRNKKRSEGGGHVHANAVASSVKASCVKGTSAFPFPFPSVPDGEPGSVTASAARAKKHVHLCPVPASAVVSSSHDLPPSSHGAPTTNSGFPSCTSCSLSSISSSSGGGSFPTVGEVHQDPNGLGQAQPPSLRPPSPPVTPCSASSPRRIPLEIQENKEERPEEETRTEDTIKEGEDERREDTQEEPSVQRASLSPSQSPLGRDSPSPATAPKRGSTTSSSSTTSTPSCSFSSSSGFPHGRSKKKRLWRLITADAPLCWSLEEAPLFTVTTVNTKWDRWSGMEERGGGRGRTGGYISTGRGIGGVATRQGRMGTGVPEGTWEAMAPSTTIHSSSTMGAMRHGGATGVIPPSVPPHLASRSASAASSSQSSSVRSERRGGGGVGDEEEEKEEENGAVLRPMAMGAGEGVGGEVDLQGFPYPQPPLPQTMMHWLPRPRAFSMPGMVERNVTPTSPPPHVMGANEQLTILWYTSHTGHRYVNKSLIDTRYSTAQRQRGGNSQSSSSGGGGNGRMRTGARRESFMPSSSSSGMSVLPFQRFTLQTRSAALYGSRMPSVHSRYGTSRMTETGKGSKKSHTATTQSLAEQWRSPNGFREAPNKDEYPWREEPVMAACKVDIARVKQRLRSISLFQVHKTLFLTCAYHEDAKLTLWTIPLVPYFPEV